MQRLTHFVSAALILATGSASAQSLDPYAPAPNGTPTTLAIDADGKVLIGGSFSDVGTDTRHGLARLDADGSVDATFADPGITSEVKTIAVQPDGKILVGGSFDTVGGQPRHGLARLNHDGSLDASFSDPGFSDSVWVIALQPDGRLLVGGSFTAIGAHVQNYLARLTASGAFDGSFGDPGLCCNPLVNAIALDDAGRVLVGGAFSHAGGVEHFYFARYSADGVLDAAFPTLENAPQPAALAVAPDGTIYLSGAGTGTLLKLDANGAPIAGFASAATDGTIESFALQPDGRVLIGGTFATVGGAPRHALARLTPYGSLDATFGDAGFRFDAANPDAFIYGIAAQSDGKPVVVGNFSLVGNTPRTYVARIATGDYAKETLVVVPNGSSVDVTWFRLGDGPELAGTPTLLHANDGTNFTAAATMTRVPNGWYASVPYDVRGAAFALKAIGATANGNGDASPGAVAGAVWSSDTIFADGFD